MGTEEKVDRPSRHLTPAQVAYGRRRAAARQRALTRLAQEFPERYRELYAEERGASR